MRLLRTFVATSAALNLFGNRHVAMWWNAKMRSIHIREGVKEPVRLIKANGDHYTRTNICLYMKY